MGRESFEKEDVANILNEHYIAIKVDREERPDVDSTYMTATQLATGRGGWPNSVWLTPEGKPWFAGTYFPRDNVGSRAGFKTLLIELSDLWNERREEVEGRAEQLSQAIRRVGSVKRIQGDGQLSQELSSQLQRELSDAFDVRYGGFGPAPKFPPHGALRFLLDQLESERNPRALEMVTNTLNAIASGGMRDHLGGGFHRYSTDNRWFLPHFEKMLYDNAQLILSYVKAFFLMRTERYGTVAREAIEWILRDMRDQDGAFFSAMDADSEGQEGRFYLWSYDEVLSVLGEEEGPLFLSVYGASEEGNYKAEAGGDKTALNILYLPSSCKEMAKREGLSLKELEGRLHGMRQRLLDVRRRRVWPNVDDKVIVAWNGLMIESLACAGRVFNESRYVEAAEKAARFILQRMLTERRLKRSYRNGAVKGVAFADDYAFFIRGLLELHDVQGDVFYLERAKELMDTFVDHYYDENAGGFFFSPNDHEHLVFRSKDIHDSATPSANGIAAQDLLLLSKYDENDRYLALMRNVLGAFSSAMARAPRGSETLIMSWVQYLEATEEKEGEEPDARTMEGPVALEAYVSSLRVAQGESLTIALKLCLEEGWHVYSHEPIQETGVATAISIGEGKGLQLEEVTYPHGEWISLGAEEDSQDFYTGTVWFVLRITVEKNAAEGVSDLSLLFQCQPCNHQRCLSPTTMTVPLELTIQSSPSSQVPRHGSIFRDLGLATI